MGRVVLFIVVATAVGGALAVAGAARETHSDAPAPAAFRLADGSVGCALDERRLACRTRAMPSAVVLDPSGRSEADDVAVAWDASTPVLLRSESWWHGEFTCRVADPDVVCEAGTGSIAVGRDSFGGASSVMAPLP